jgi:hypothetical protein
MAYTKYSLTPSSNTAAPPDGAPEGMLPSAVNDTMRDMMSQIRDCGDGIRDGTYTMTAAKITGGSITGLSSALPVASGGTGVTTSTGTVNVVLSTSPTITTPVITGFTETVVAIGTVGASHTFTITTGTVQTATLTASTPCTFTMPTATAGKSFILKLTQAATGMTTATFTGVKFAGGTAPTITATASAVDLISFIADGTSWFGSAIQNLS